MKLSQNWKNGLSLLGIALGLLILFYLRAILVYLLVAVVISFICEPFSDLLRKIRIRKWVLPTWFRALFTLVVFVSVILGILALFAPLLSREIELISSIDPYQTSLRIEQKISEWQSSGSMIAGALADIDFASSFPKWLESIFSWGKMEGMFQNVFGFLGSIAVAIFSILFMSFFFLKDGMLFGRMVIVLTPDRYLEKVKTILQHSHTLLRRYFIGLALQSLIMMIMISLGLWLLGIENAIIIGLLAGLLNVIPYLGPFTAICIGMIVALTTSLHLDFNTAVLPLMIKVPMIFFIAQMIDGFFVQPLVLGSSVKAHPLEIYIVILAAGILGGPIFMMLAIPSYTILRVIAKEFFAEFKVVESLTRELKEEENE